jgi:diadenosine tetraphosphate (Ap4A) HIT family hydrolase
MSDSKAEMPCPFCSDRPANLAAENQLAFAKWDGYPLSKGHVLLIPRRHVPSIFDCTNEERVAMLELLDATKLIIDGLYKPDGYNIGINNGAAAGQTVMHLHIHLIPRYEGDRADPRGGVRWIIPEKAAYWEKI